MGSCRVLLVPGSLRVGSTNAAALRTAAVVAPSGTTTTYFDGLGGLPPYNPDDDTEPLDHAVAGLRTSIAQADAVLLSTPEYAGALPGSFKNLLDWTVGGNELAGKPVAWINASYSLMGAADAHASLRRVLGFVSAEIVEEACVHLPVTRQLVGPDGLVADPAVRAKLAGAMGALVAHAMRPRR
jgi:NAD(P)H-dependent FMN reductase